MTLDFRCRRCGCAPQLPAIAALAGQWPVPTRSPRRSAIETDCTALIGGSRTFGARKAPISHTGIVRCWTSRRWRGCRISRHISCERVEFDYFLAPSREVAARYDVRQLFFPGVVRAPIVATDDPSRCSSCCGHGPDRGIFPPPHRAAFRLVAREADIIFGGTPQVHIRSERQIVVGRCRWRRLLRPLLAAFTTLEIAEIFHAIERDRG